MSLTPGGMVPVGANSKEVVPAATTTYTLTVKGAHSTVEAKCQVEVTPYTPPSITQFRADPETIAPGQTARLSWATTGDVTGLDVTPGAPVTLAINSLEVSPQATTRYRLEASARAAKPRKR